MFINRSIEVNRYERLTDDAQVLREDGYADEEGGR